MPIAPVLPVVNAAQYAVKQDALDAAHSAGGGMVMLPPRTIDEPLIIYDDVHLRGQGSATVLTLANGSPAGTNVIETANYATLAAGTTTGGPARWSISDLTIDGNKANNASGGSGLAIYGRNFQLDRLDIRNCKTDGITSKWALGSSGLVSNESMEASVVGLRVHHNDRHNINWDGPHDSQFVNTNVYYAGNSADLGDGFHITSNATGSQFVNCHSWGYGQKWAWWIEAGYALLVGCFGEGGGAVLTGGQLMIRASSVSVFGGIYFSGGATRGISIGDATSGAITGLDVITAIRNCTGGAVLFQNDGGGNTIWPNIGQASGTVDSGTISTSTDYRPRVGGGVSYTSRAQQIMPQLLRVASASALAINDNASGLVFNVRTDAGNERMELARGLGLRTYSDGFSTRTFDFDTANGIMYLGAFTAPSIRKGTGSPEGVVTAAVGSLYLRADGGAGTSMYVKESNGTGNTGWVAK